MQLPQLSLRLPLFASIIPTVIANVAVVISSKTPAVIAAIAALIPVIFPIPAITLAVEC